MITPLRFTSVALAAALLAATLPAIAQWQWIDKDGRKVFSDRAPPADGREKDILKRSFRRNATPLPASSQVVATMALGASAASAPRLAAKDSELELRKKQAEKEDGLKKKAEDDKQAKTKQDNCDRAKVALVTLQSGVRVVTINATGEREVMDDAKRAGETRRVKEAVDVSCQK